MKPGGIRPLKKVGNDNVKMDSMYSDGSRIFNIFINFISLAIKSRQGTGS